MSELISGKDALIALANGEVVQDIENNEWISVDCCEVRYLLNCIDVNRFRLKPKTIFLNDVEIPAPFKPKVGDYYWYLSPSCKNGYNCCRFEDLTIDKNIIQFGAWDSEDKIKEVVKAVRNVFNCGDEV